jgi:hypothetical protein
MKDFQATGEASGPPTDNPVLQIMKILLGHFIFLDPDLDPQKN